MSGTKIAMPQPNSFHSGALSFMSCTSGRESSPLDENDSHQTTEFKSETKKKRFHPLRNLRRMFRRKTRRSSISAESYQPSALDNPELTSTNLEHRSCSTSRLQEENLTQSLIRNSRLNPGLSLSHDSIFTPDRADSGLSSSDLENSSLSITVLTPPSKECPIKSQSSCSEISLLSIGSSEVELSPVRSGKISELDLGVTAYKLSHSAAKHKMAVKPRRNHGVPRSRRRAMASKSPLPITIEVSEEGATGRISPLVESSDSFSKCDKRLQDGKTTWSNFEIDYKAQEAEEKENESMKAEDDLDGKEEEVATQRSESFFGRFLSRRSDKKKKHVNESSIEESNDEKSHFVKKAKGGGGGGKGRKTPTRRQRMEPVEISSANTFEKEEFLGKKMSSSVSPPKNYWPSQVTSRSISPPKVVWPDYLSPLEAKESSQAIWNKTSVSSPNQLNETILKDWKNPNFVKELTDSVSLFAKEKSEKRENEEEDFVLKLKNQHSTTITVEKTLFSVENDLSLRKKSEFVESPKGSDVENVILDVVAPNYVKTPNVCLLPFSEVHDDYENIQIIEQVKQEVRIAEGDETVVVETKPQSPEIEKSIKLETDFNKIKKPETVKEAEVVKRVKPALTEKPKDIKRVGQAGFIKINANEGESKIPEENGKTVPKSKSTLVERRKSELLLLTESEEKEKEWKGKTKSLKKQTSFSETSNEKCISSKISPSNEKRSSLEKTEFEPVEEVVVLRKKSVANTFDDQPELMKVFARRSLKVKESEKIAEEIQRSRDSDKENEILDSPGEDRKKASAFEREEKKETEFVISKEFSPKVKISEVSIKPEITSKKNIFQRYGRSLSENNAKSADESEFKGDSPILEENTFSKMRNILERTSSGKLEREKQKKREEEEEEEGGGGQEQEEESGFKRIQQRKAEWEKRAQQGAK